MKKYILKRFLQLIPVLVGITFLSFAMMRIAGSDAITELYGDKGAVAQEIIDAKRAELGLDQPFLTQYLAWVGGILTGDMGISYISGRDVFQTFVSKLPATLLLTVLAICATVIISIPLGVLAAVRHDKFTDYFLRFFSFIGNSLPNFFVALLLMQVFSIHWSIFPVISNGTTVQSAVLPTLTLAVAMSAKYMRQVRATVLEELNKDYVEGAKARGVRGRVILWKSVLKSSMLTIITLLALSIGSLLGGTAIIESIFMWDGVGKLAVDAITMRDYPLIQAYVVWMAIIYVMVNLITDLLYHALDPRIRLGVSDPQTENPAQQRQSPTDCVWNACRAADSVFCIFRTAYPIRSLFAGFDQCQSPALGRTSAGHRPLWARYALARYCGKPNEHFLHASAGSGHYRAGNCRRHLLRLERALDGHGADAHLGYVSRLSGTGVRIGSGRFSGRRTSKRKHCAGSDLVAEIRPYCPQSDACAEGNRLDEGSEAVGKQLRQADFQTHSAEYHRSDSGDGHAGYRHDDDGAGSAELSWPWREASYSRMGQYDERYAQPDDHFAVDHVFSWHCNFYIRHGF